MKRQFYLDHCERHLLRLALQHLRKRAMESQNFDASHFYCKKYTESRIYELEARLAEVEPPTEEAT